MGFRITKEEIEDPENDYLLEIYWTDKVGEPIPQNYTINTDKTKKEVFLKHFGGGIRGSSKLKGAKPWSSVSKSLEANFYADLGNGLNKKIYFDRGWIADTKGGFSNMALLQINPTDAIHYRPTGWEILYGERAFEKYMILKPDWSPDSINRWNIK